jgi:hypothetical protein
MPRKTQTICTNKNKNKIAIQAVKNTVSKLLNAKIGERTEIGHD